MTRVAFQGIAGAYSEEAVRQQFADVEVVPCRTFEGIFAAVEEGEAEYGMLPIENSLAGSVIQAYELLMEHDLRVRAEAILRVRHCLMAVPGTQLADRWGAFGWKVLEMDGHDMPEILSTLAAGCRTGTPRGPPRP